MNEHDCNAHCTRVLVFSQIENMVTVTATALLVYGLYSSGAGGWAASGFLLLLNLNYLKKPLRKEEPK